MAINHQRREDLMREATAYHRRILLRDVERTTIFVGLRSTGGWSIYFEEDPVFQFNAQGKLRRVHFAEQNYGAEGGELRLLQRTQRGGHVSLNKVDCKPLELEICQDCTQRLAVLTQQFEQGAIEVLERFPADSDFVAAVIELMRGVVCNFAIAESANA